MEEFRVNKKKLMLIKTSEIRSRSLDWLLIPAIRFEDFR